MEATLFDAIHSVVGCETHAKTLATLVAELPHLLCAVMGIEVRRTSNGMYVANDDVTTRYHSIRDLLLTDIMSIPLDYTTTVSTCSPPERVIGNMLVGMMGDRIAILPAPAQMPDPTMPLSVRLSDSLLALGFPTPLFVHRNTLVVMMPDRSIGLYCDPDDDAFLTYSRCRYQTFHELLVSCGLVFGGGRSLLSRVTFSIKGEDDGDMWVAGPSVPMTRSVPELHMIDDLVLDKAMASDVVEFTKPLVSPGDSVLLSSCEEGYAAIALEHGWEFKQYYDPVPNASAFVTISHAGDEHFTNIIVNPISMRQIVDILSHVNLGRLSDAQLLLELYPHIVTVFDSDPPVQPVVEIVPFAWSQQATYFSRFPSVTRPNSIVVELVYDNPYNTAEILSRHLARTSSTSTLRAQVPPIYDGTCAVCLSRDVPLDNMVQYDCRHVFCEECAREVMTMTGSNACPLCRHVTNSVRAPMRDQSDLIECVDFTNAISAMRAMVAQDDRVVVLSDIPAILAVFPGANKVRDFAGKTVLFCGRPRLLDAAMKMRNTFRKGVMSVRRFEIEHGLDEFVRRYDEIGAVSDQMLSFWMTRWHDDKMKAVQVWIDRFSNMSALRSWQGPGFFVHPHVLYNPVNNMMKHMGSGGYVSVETMTEVFSRCDMTPPTSPITSDGSDMDL